MGSGEGMASARLARACVLRAGVVARARLTAAFLLLLLLDGAPEDLRLLAWALLRGAGRRERAFAAALGRLAPFFVRPDFTGVSPGAGKNGTTGGLTRPPKAFYQRG